MARTGGTEVKDVAAGLNGLKKGDITEIKSLSKPPSTVKLVMEAVCVALGEEPDWASAKRVLGDPNLLRRLRAFDKDRAPAAVVAKLAEYTARPDFAPERVK